MENETGSISPAETIIAVIYDPGTGDILYTAQGSRANVEADGKPFVEVDQWRLDYSEKYSVRSGKLVDKAAI